MADKGGLNFWGGSSSRCEERKVGEGLSLISHLNNPAIKLVFFFVFLSNN